jgi:hypothetical protein
MLDRLRPPSLILFAVLSIVLHGAIFGVLRRGAPAGGPTFHPAPQTVAGDTLDVESLAPTASDVGGEGALVAGDHAVDRAGEHPRSSEPAGARKRASAASRDGPSPAAVFGAVGVRVASDLATAFTRAFPQAASADPIWPRAPVGSAGVAEVVLVLDDSGRLRATSIEGSPSPALRRGIERTFALVTSRTFTARGPVTRLRVTAHVSRDRVHDGLHGDVFALSGGSYAGDLGTAFFTLPPRDGESGQRVDVEVRVLP